VTTAPAVSATSGRQSRPLPLRVVLLVPAAICLLAGLDAALLLLGLPAPVEARRLPDLHGMLLVLGFVGTLVSLERAVALRHPAGFVAPSLLGGSALVLLSPAALQAGQVGFVAGTAALVAVYVPLWRRQRDDAVLVQALGAVLAVGAATLWLGGVPVADLLPWLAGFVVLTICGERLELARLTMGPRAGTSLVLLACTVTVGVVGALLWPAPGTAFLGAAVLSLTAWIASHDVALRTVRSTGAARYMAACMLAGYGWLVVAGAVWLLGPAEDGGYDAVTHAVFLGFTISMIMAHAPVILPAVVRRPLPYRPVMWVPVALLHAGLVIRLWLGDALDVRGAWQIGGVLGVVALLVFAASAGWSAATAEQTARTDVR